MDFRKKNLYHFRFLSLRDRVQFHHAINTASRVIMRTYPSGMGKIKRGHISNGIVIKRGGGSNGFQAEESVSFAVPYFSLLSRGK